MLYYQRKKSMIVTQTLQRIFAKYLRLGVTEAILLAQKGRLFE
jgi:hypothetical protein